MRTVKELHRLLSEMTGENTGVSVDALHRRIIALHIRRARLAEAYGLWAGERLTPRQRQRLARLARAIKRLCARVREMESAK